MPKLLLHLKPADTAVPVVIGRNLWPDIVQFIRERYPDYTLFLIADRHLTDLYSEAAEAHLQQLSGFREILSFPAGEASKSRAWKATLEDALLKKKAGRDTLLLAMGGGVTGDLAGYVAATLHRGIPLLHIPTSLLAQVDSSIGGKTGINVAAGKNLVGAFHQPAAVFADTAFFRTLPREEFINGLAEVIKYAVTLDAGLWELLEKEQPAILDQAPEVTEAMVRRCAELKIRVVEQDEKETGLRSLLNFGHTVGHAIEKLSRFRVKHGFAVAAGMRVAARLSGDIFGYPAENIERLQELLGRYDLLRVNPAEYPAADLWKIMTTDKKARGQTPRFTLLGAQGEPKLFHPVRQKELKSALSHA